MNKKITPVILVILLFGYFTLSTLLNRPEQQSLYYGEAQGNTFHINASTSGLIKEILASPNESIIVGQHVASLINTDLDYQIELAKNQALIAQSQLKKATGPIRDEELTIITNKIESLDENKKILENSKASLYASLKDLRVSQDLAGEVLLDRQQTFDNTKELYEQGAVSKAVLDQTRLALKSAESNFESLKLKQSNMLEEIDSVQTKVALLEIERDSANQTLMVATSGINNEDLTMAQLTSKNAQLAVDRLVNLSNDLSITALQAGTIETINYEIGEFVTPGMPIITCFDPDMISLNIYVKEKDLQKLTIGDRYLTRLAGSDSTDSTEAVITTIANEAMFTPLNTVTIDDRERLVFKVVLTLERAKWIKPGMLLEVDLSILNGDKNE
ncbi:MULTISPECIES: HlyD family secretion protein [unclassified Fusibacter]|uniref:HlyD family secretion protein n=1 Tax=unclassified Fusibacter TaxID=2624464 RepID=UPI0010133C0B|nr:MULTISPECIES: HlyD family secretion protein [unclassified Fusibacter]MCK8059093.1 HlyD family efflux transporter periplasmic adaptor subunit [Fusibacter sp. A2]NPE22502.1 HlyD family efflux transporter periplasmic adaptor subunit [Fusibacter sp. A1]RXV60605.1 HlyD family efflux transporter periplasmic adaptor subunit [Fusibacter sp. A1]